MTANAATTRLMNNVRINVPGALDTVVKLEFFNALDDFFKGSNIWKEKIPVSVDPTKDTYDVVPTDSGAINRLLWVIDPSGVAVNATMEEPGTLVLQYKPGMAQTYTACVAKTVTDPTTKDDYPQYPDWVLDKYGDDLVNGVVGRLMKQPKKPYTDLQLAQYYLKSFEQAIGFARIEAARMNTYAAQTWRFPQSFAVRRKGASSTRF
jgi:hypothetical protein